MVAKNAGFAVSTRCDGPASDAKTAMDWPNNVRRSSSGACSAAAEPATAVDRWPGTAVMVWVRLSSADTGNDRRCHPSAAGGRGAAELVGATAGAAYPCVPDIQVLPSNHAPQPVARTARRLGGSDPLLPPGGAGIGPGVGQGSTEEQIIGCTDDPPQLPRRFSGQRSQGDVQHRPIPIVRGATAGAPAKMSSRSRAGPRTLSVQPRSARPISPGYKRLLWRSSRTTSATALPEMP